MLTNRRNQAAMGAVSRALASQMPQVLGAITNYATKNLFGETGHSRPAMTRGQGYMPGNSVSFNSGRSSGKRGRKKGKGRGRKDQIIRNPRDGVCMVELRDFTAVVNTTVLTYNYNLALGVNAGTNTQYIGGSNWIARLGTMSNVYQYVEFIELDVTWVPSLPYTVGGQLSIGFDPNPMPTNPNSYAAVLRHDPSVMADIKDSFTVTWKPRNEFERLPKPMNAVASHTAGDDICNAGCLQMYGLNTQNDTSTTIGGFHFRLLCRLRGLK
jgi:hypothetical protein